MPVFRLLLLAPALLLAACLSNASVQSIEPDRPVSAPTSFDHSAFSALLADVVDERGFVDYAALAADPAPLDGYLGRLAATDPSALSDDDRLAFWLNVYNAYTLKLVVDNYPIDSIHDVVSGAFIPLVNTPFKVEFVTVGGDVMTLDGVEHGTIREEFDEPRIHFALVCAAISCPPLRAEAYVGDRLDTQLEEQGRIFLSNPAKNRVPADAETIRLSKIFDWFGGDFGDDDAALQAFIAPYFDGDVRDRLARGAYDIEFLSYDWSLNDTNDDP
ncbi:MAG: DUF547 domain-containing protein [Rhodothermales bacterium]